MKKLPLLAVSSLSALVTNVSADQVIADDLIVQGSAGIGLDSNNGENFGFDTLRLKENNLRIKFQDTSSSASFPTQDWQLTANDTTNGGLNKFSIDNIDTGRTPFTIEGGAPSHSLYVDDGGRVGVGNNSPVVEMHITNGDSPTMRLEQNGSSGFTAQTWDVAGNEANFFVRDATNGSKLPFKIKPGAPDNSLFIAAVGDIGLGTASPSADLHVVGTDTSDVILATGSPNTNKLAYKGDGSFSVETATNKFTYDSQGLLTLTKTIFGSTSNLLALDSGGNLTVSGTVMGSSDVDRKENFSEVNTSEILEKVAQLPIKHWSYKGEDTIHVGPMAQDFSKSFGVGSSDKAISMADADGVAMASIQELYKKVQEKDSKIDALNQKNQDLEQRLKRLERLLGNSDQ